MDCFCSLEMMLTSGWFFVIVFGGGFFVLFVFSSNASNQILNPLTLLGNLLVRDKNEII